MRKLVQLRDIDGTSLDPKNLNYETKINEHDNSISNHETRITKLEETVLYNYPPGDTNVILNDSVANYDYIEIMYKETSSNKKYSSGKLYDTNGYKTTLSYVEYPNSTTGNIRLFGCEFSINGTSISATSNYGFSTANGSDSVHYENRVRIIKVLGYKASS